MPPSPEPARPRGPRARPVDTARILDAAQEVFSAKGMEGATMRAVARRAGCDPALIYYHFEGKEGLFLALAQRRLPPIAEAMARLADPADQRPTRERLWQALEVFHQHLGQDAGFRGLFRGQLMAGSDTLKDAIAGLLRPIIQQLIQLLVQGQERGELRPDLDPRLGAFFIGRMHMEILDLVPSMGARMTGVLAPHSLLSVRQAWLDFAWRAIAAHPVPPGPLPEARP